MDYDGELYAQYFSLWTLYSDMARYYLGGVIGDLWGDVS